MDVAVVDYDPTWPEQFRALRDRAASALGDLTLAIEHVGSTSVPGLAAKPIIDLDIIVRTTEDVQSAIARLATLGYVHEGNLGIPQREAFQWPPGEPRHHLYVCPSTSHGLRDHLLFRDYLRARPDVVRAYADLKRDLANQFAHDRDAYQRGKQTFIDRMTREAACTTTRS